MGWGKAVLTVMQIAKNPLHEAVTKGDESRLWKDKPWMGQSWEIYQFFQTVLLDSAARKP